MPKGVVSICGRAFYWCIALNGIFSKGVTSIGSIVIPRSVTRIGEYAFRACEKLSSVTINRNCTAGIYAFPSTCHVYYY